MRASASNSTSSRARKDYMPRTCAASTAGITEKPCKPGRADGPPLADCDLLLAGSHARSEEGADRTTECNGRQRRAIALHGKQQSGNAARGEKQRTKREIALVISHGLARLVGLGGLDGRREGF